MRYVIFRNRIRLTASPTVDEPEIEIAEVYETSKRNWKQLKKAMKKLTISIRPLPSERYRSIRTIKKSDVIGYGSSIEDIHEKFAEYLI